MSVSATPATIDGDPRLSIREDKGQLPTAIMNIFDDGTHHFSNGKFHRLKIIW